jgi:aspartate racemase
VPAPLTIGIVGGMSPESTATYYRTIVRLHTEQTHNHAYPRIVIASVSFQEYVDWQHAGDWDAIAAGFQAEFEAVAAAGADFALLATNTMHKVLPRIAGPIPILSILDVVGDFARSADVACIGLTGTRFTMSDGFYAAGLESRGLRVVVPDKHEQDTIHRIIYADLIRGVVTAEARTKFADIANSLARRGAEAVLLGCTELGLLTRDQPLVVQTIDTARLHAEAAWETAVGQRPL